MEPITLGAQHPVLGILKRCNCVSRGSGSLPPRLTIVCNVCICVFVNVIEVFWEATYIHPSII